MSQPNWIVTTSVDKTIGECRICKTTEMTKGIATRETLESWESDHLRKCVIRFTIDTVFDVPQYDWAERKVWAG